MMQFLLLLVLPVLVICQEENPQIFELPRAPQDALKPKINKDLASYFELTGPYSNLFDVILGPRPGFVPRRNFEVVDFEPSDPRYRFRSVASPGTNTLPLAPRARTQPFAQQNLTPEQQQEARDNLRQILPGLKSGANKVPFSFDRQGAPKLSIGSLPDSGNRPVAANLGSNLGSKSSVAGIPQVFPTLPKAPIPQTVVGDFPSFPPIPTKPQVPQGGLGPLSSLSEPSSSNLQKLLAEAQRSSNSPSAFPVNNLGGFGGGNSLGLGGSGNSGVFDTVLDAFGLGGSQGAGSGPNLGLGGPTLDSKGLDLSGINSLLGLNGKNTGVLSSVIYNALTDSAVNTQEKPNSTIVAPTDAKSGASAISSFLPSAGLQQNIALIQNLLTQPSSPLCTPKPQPVSPFDIDAFMGTWYQVLYSPPMSSGPCSMVSYRKLSDVGGGGPGTVFDTFEYMTEGTRTGQPRISSGYSIVKSPGQLIYRTTSSASDVNVNILSLGPLNSNAQYEYVVMAVNCNYPLHVYSRDPIRYKQKYEVDVTAELERRGLTNGFSRLLNIVAPVDNTLCRFPPNLFNIRS